MTIITSRKLSFRACAVIALTTLSGLPSPPADARPQPPGISIGDARVVESGGYAEFLVSLDASPSGRRAVYIEVATREGAAGEADFVARNGTLSFQRGDPLSKAFRVAILDDNIPENEETFSVRLSSPENGRIIDGTGVGTIVDDDNAVNRPPTCRIDNPAGDSTIAPGGEVVFSATVTDPDGDPVSISWQFPGGTPGSASAEDPGSVRFDSTGNYTITLDASDPQGLACARQTRRVTVGAGGSAPDVSINSTSVTGLIALGMSPVPERPRVLGTDHRVLAVNDLGMHCVDLDGRIANILPPFQVLPVQVIRRGVEPELNPAGVELYYSAASNPSDPILSAADVPSSVAPDGTVFKSNFWQMLLAGAWENFYPPVLPKPLGQLVGPDQGLLVPNTEALYIGADHIVDGVAGSADGELAVSQQTMPGIGNPLVANEPQPVHEHYTDKPFFINFPFGYVAAGVNLYEGAGIPFSPFDDYGRQNPFPLVRVEARSGAQVLATVDTVLPVSGETSCSNCHADPADVSTTRSTAPTDRLLAAGLPVAHSGLDPQLGSVPQAVSVEYGADINILRLHDLVHGDKYVSAVDAWVDADNTGLVADPCVVSATHPDGDSASCLVNQALVQGKPVVCQGCHYTPALDLAQVGPASGPVGSAANGRNQVPHQTNSRVMHSHHGGYTDLFPPIPQAIQDPLTGGVINQDARSAALENNCYQCHPGKETHCLRGAMFNAGILCSDCHGTMEQIGADFSTGVSPANPGAFQLGLGNFYDPGSPQKRVPWANEPGCGSCHTGDANSNLAGADGVLVNARDSRGVADGIRLRQAYVSGDPKATPIVPVNKVFAEPAVPAVFNGFVNPGAGNPRLYRLSSGHGGVMCEGCHGATHAEWPVADPDANDNLLAMQMQGHTGPIIECTACHDTSGLPANTLDGPHNMHLVDDRRFWKEAHKDAAKRENGRPGGGACGSCHGADHRGTVLSRAAADRSFLVEDSQRLVSAGEPVACNLCHSLEKSFGR